MSDLLHELASIAEDGLLNVVIDTPAGSASKYKYDEKHHCYRLSRLLPRGMVFPYSFGSIPRTTAEDGDALDILILAEYSFGVGCLVAVKLIGVLKAEQGSSGKTIRNDRLLGVPVTEVNAAAFDEIDELDATTIDEIEHFFVAYNQAHGRRFQPVGRGGSKEAAELLRLAQARYAEARDEAIEDQRLNEIADAEYR